MFEQKYETGKKIQLKIVIFTAMKNCNILHRRVFVMCTICSEEGMLRPKSGEKVENISNNYNIYCRICILCVCFRASEVQFCLDPTRIGQV